MPAYDSNQLRAEVLAAGLGVMVVTIGDDVAVVSPDGMSLRRVDDAEEWVNVAALKAVIAAHVPPPPPLVFSLPIAVTGRARSAGVVTAEIYRLPLDTRTGYDFMLTLLGVDAASGAVRKIVASITAKRLLGAPALVGALTTLVSHADTGTTSWAIQPSFVGNDAVISVAGSAGRTVDWNLSGTVTTFSPDGKAMTLNDKAIK